MAIGALLDGIPESIVIGLSLLKGEGVSLVAVIAIFLSNIPEGLSNAARMGRAGWLGTHVFHVWRAITLASRIASWLSDAASSGVSPEVIATITAVAAGAILSVLDYTMLPEAFEEAHDAAGLITVVDFFATSMLSKLDN